MYNSYITVTRIDEQLKAHGVTKKQLNERCGIDKSTINNSASAKNGLSAKILYDSAEFLSCSVDYLLGRTDSVQLEAPTLSPLELELIEHFRACSDLDKGRLLGEAKIMSENFEKGVG